jgi:hypothetical protein
MSPSCLLVITFLKIHAFSARWMVSCVSMEKIQFWAFMNHGTVAVWTYNIKMKYADDWNIFERFFYVLSLGFIWNFCIHIPNILIWLFWENLKLFIKSWRIELFGYTHEHCKSHSSSCWLHGHSKYLFHLFCRYGLFFRSNHWTIRFLHVTFFAI